MRQHQRLTVTDAQVLDRVDELLRDGTAPQADDFEHPRPPLEIRPRRLPRVPLRVEGSGEKGPCLPPVPDYSILTVN